MLRFLTLKGCRIDSVKKGAISYTSESVLMRRSLRKDKLVFVSSGKENVKYSLYRMLYIVFCDIHDIIYSNEGSDYSGEQAE